MRPNFSHTDRITEYRSSCYLYNLMRQEAKKLGITQEYAIRQYILEKSDKFRQIQ